MHSKEKAAFCCCVGPMYNKVCISFYQTDANCVLIKTQPQPRSRVAKRAQHHNDIKIKNIHNNSKKKIVEGMKLHRN
jgi:hypothetical protein